MIAGRPTPAAPVSNGGHRAGALPAWAALLVLCAGVLPSMPAAASPWNGDYFPNVVLTDQHGETFRFFDDLVEGKVVVINFIYTSCVDACPLETAHLVEVARILGDRVGSDVFFYSITIDPEHDTPEVLHEYAERFRANWQFLTGSAQDVELLRRRLGLYIEDIQDGSRNHNISMVIGNQASGQWRKSSPFRNPYMAAETIGQWLSGWAGASAGGDYDRAPALRNLSRGEQLFRTRCATCHSIGASDPTGAIGPDLAGVTRKRDREWLIDWLRAPDEMIARRDPIAMDLLERYDDLVMPNLRLNQVDVMALIEFMARESERVAGASTGPARGASPVDVLAVANATVNAATVAEGATAGYLTLVNFGTEPAVLVGLDSPAAVSVQMHEMAILDGLPTMRALPRLALSPGASITFAPAGRHLMLKGLRQALVPGQTLPVVLEFASGETQSVPFRVVFPGSSSPAAAPSTVRSDPRSADR